MFFNKSNQSSFFLSCAIKAILFFINFLRKNIFLLTILKLKIINVSIFDKVWVKYRREISFSYIELLLNYIIKRRKIYKNRVKICINQEKMEFREIEYINRDTEKVN